MKLYNFGIEKNNPDPDLTISWDILDQNGRQLAQTSFKLVDKPNRVSPTIVEYLLELDAFRPPPGLCWLRAGATDNVTGHSAVEWVPLHIE